MKKLIGCSIVLSATIWGQAVSPAINQTPTRQFGHPTLDNPLTQAAPNLVEGREFNAPGQIALDASANPPILYVADIANNRVLGFKSIASLNAGNKADLVIGQQDFVSTLAQGPGTVQSTGLNAPTGVAVDAKGNLYVADAGNNRILRFPAPFSQPAGGLQPDLVVGQKGFNTGNSANEGGNCASKTLAYSAGGSLFLTMLAIDPSGNLWTSDGGNNRVLMFPPANLSPFAVEPVATIALGQNNFTTCTPGANGPSPQLTKTNTIVPTGVAFDASGNLYVSDSFSRVLYFVGPNFSLGQAAARVLGVSPPPTSSSNPTVFPNQYSLGSPNSANNLIPPSGVFTLGNNLFVADTPSNRIVEYDIPSKWPAESTAFPSPPALAVFGQNGFSVGQPNQGQAQSNQFTLSGPYAGAFTAAGQMWIADTANNRVLAFSPSAGTYTGASVVVGQTDYPYNAPNLIEGREVFLSGSLVGSASGIVVDKNSNPPHLYVADPGNNRILCFADARKVGQSSTVADLVIGQTDMKSSIVNSPGGKALNPTQTGLSSPIGLAVDNNGNLYVADSGNGRVLRFPAPFSQAPGATQTANLVLGQSSFTSLIQNASANSMHSPYGIAIFADSTGTIPLAGGIAVSDPLFNRVLLYKKSGSDFLIGQSAYLAIGQQNFTTTGSGQGNAAFNSPRGLASDTSDRLYVADSQNNRVLVFDQAPEIITNGPTSTQQYPNISQPQGVAVSSITTELWITNTGGDQVLRYPEYTHCQIISCSATALLFTNAFPLGIALDATDNVIIGDSANRITFYFAQTFFRNAASFNTQSLAPGMLAALGRYGLPMNIEDAAASTNPWPYTLADLTVSVNGIPAPVFATNKQFGAIYFQVPQTAPTSGIDNVQVTQASTQAVLGVGSFQAAKVNPAFFAANATGLGAVSARNLPDQSPNTAANPVNRGSDFYVCLTGAGQIPGGPPDGQAPTAAAPTPSPLPTLLVDGIPTTISYSGVGCGFPGGWQINATVPANALPNAPNSIVLSYLGVASNYGGTTASDGISPGPDSHPIALTLFVGK